MNLLEFKALEDNGNERKSTFMNVGNLHLGIEMYI
jgi:hypothetical protein